METEKKYFGGWYVWILFLMIIGGIILTGLNYAGMLGRTIVERKVFENSYQKSESDKTARNTYDSQLTVLRARLSNTDLSKTTRSEIQAQIDSIRILKGNK